MCLGSVWIQVVKLGFSPQRQLLVEKVAVVISRPSSFWTQLNHPVQAACHVQDTTVMVRSMLLRGFDRECVAGLSEEGLLPQDSG